MSYASNRLDDAGCSVGLRDRARMNGRPPIRGLAEEPSSVARRARPVHAGPTTTTQPGQRGRLPLRNNNLSRTDLEPITLGNRRFQKFSYSASRFLAECVLGFSRKQQDLQAEDTKQQFGVCAL